MINSLVNTFQCYVDNGAGTDFFSAPYVSHIKDNLYLGGVGFNIIIGPPAPDNIKHVVSLYPACSFDVGPNVTYHHHPMSDDHSGVDTNTIIQLSDLVLERLDDGPTLVHCQVGVNRSGLVSAYSLMRRYNMKAIDAIALLREQRHRCVLSNNTFYKWLLDNEVV